MIRNSTQATGRRQRRREARTNEILDHALAIVIADGVDGLTMPRLASACDAAVGALYRYFPSKEAVVGALQVVAVAALRAFLASRMTGGPLERVRAAATGWVAFADSQPALFALVDRALASPQPMLSDEEALRVDAAVREALGPLVDALAAAVEDGTLTAGDAEVRAHALWAAVYGAAHFRKRDRILPTALHASTLRDILVEGLIDGWKREVSV